MEIEFDPDKDKENVRKRGIPLTFDAVVLANMIGEVEDRRYGYGEKRMKAFGLIKGLWFACAYTMRGSVVRIVTVHGFGRRRLEDGWGQNDAGNHHASQAEGDRPIS